MTDDRLPHAPRFAATRAGALGDLAAFVPKSGRYARDRNHVLPGHPNVSRLSPAITHGLLTIEECSEAVCDRYAASTVEKFLQELQWRRYWKAWLSMRPQVWKEYVDALQRLNNDPGHLADREEAARVANGDSPVAIMNHFARELTATGYLHNHARMWFAGWWIHVARLPWQLGADFFFRNLLDADPASNTLSWRWVAGLQTPGKTYLPRRSNLEKYLHPDLLADHAAGMELLENPTAKDPGEVRRPPVTVPDQPQEFPAPGVSTGLWVHDEDLLPEQGPLSSLAPKAVLLAAGDLPANAPEHRRHWRQTAVADTRDRCGEHFGVPPSERTGTSLQETLATWAREQDLRQIVALRPDVGPLDDEVPQIREALEKVEATLVLLDRPEKRAVRSLATAGFFSFWKKQQAGARG